MAIGALASTPILKIRATTTSWRPKEDIAVDIDGDRMTISAHRSAETEEKDDNSQYLRRERSYGSFSRSFDISNIKSEEISGAYHDGVLTLTLPKKNPTAPSTSRRLDIQ